MTHSLPRRRTERQCMQIFLTDAFTFIPGIQKLKVIIQNFNY